MNFYVKNTTVKSIMDLICPYKCRGCGKIGSALCECCKNYITGRAVWGVELPEGLFVGGARDGLLARLVVDYKYNSVRGLAQPLAEIVAARVPEGPKFRDVVVVPLPTIARHVRARGFDHTLLLARELAAVRGWRCERLLVRVNNSVQVGASGEERVRQAESAYAVDAQALLRVKDRLVLLVDDVTTTGASLAAAERVVREAGITEVMKAVVAKGIAV